MLFCSLPGINKVELNVMFTLFLGIVAIKCYESVENKFLKYFLVLSIGLLGLLLRVDYKMYGIIMIFILYRFRDSKIKMVISFAILVFVRHIILAYYNGIGISPYVLKICLSIIASLIFILLYNGKQGKKIQKFYYWFYPVHMLVLYLVSPYTFNIFNL